MTPFMAWREKMKLLTALLVFVGIPACFVLLHAQNRLENETPAPLLTSIPSYDEQRIERCFFWVPDEEEKPLKTEEK